MSSMATTASIAIISSLGLTYLLDSYKDRSDKNLRDELKDRVQSSLNDTSAKLDQLIDRQRDLEQKMVTREHVESIVKTRIEELQAKMELEEVNKKALRLKVRSKAAGSS